MIKFTDGKKEYIWNDNDEIIGMNEVDAEVLKMQLQIADDESFGYLPVTRDVFKEQGFTIIEDDETEEETEEDKYLIY